MALIGVGHLVGMTVGIAMLIGMLISWAVLVPVLTSMQGVGADVAATVNDVFRNQVRFIGAGTIGVAAVWTLLKIIGPIVAGIRSAMAASAARAGGEAAGAHRARSADRHRRRHDPGVAGPDRRPAVVVHRGRPDRGRRAGS